MNVILPTNIKEWFQNWLAIQAGKTFQSRLDNETVRLMIDILTDKLEGDYVVFNNAGGVAFAIWAGNDPNYPVFDVEKFISHVGQSYIYCYRINGIEMIKRYFVWNIPKTSLEYFNVTSEDIKHGFVTFED